MISSAATPSKPGRAGDLDEPVASVVEAELVEYGPPLKVGERGEVLAVEAYDAKDEKGCAATIQQCRAWVADVQATLKELEARTGRTVQDNDLAIEHDAPTAHRLQARRAHLGE